MATKQSELDGMERAKIAEIEEAAEAYVSVRDRRMNLTEKEIAAKAALVEVVVAHEKELYKDGDGNRVYRYDDEIVILKPGRVNVKVKHAVDDDDEDDYE